MAFTKYIVKFLNYHTVLRNVNRFWRFDTRFEIVTKTNYMCCIIKVVFHSKFPIFAIFLNIHKASPNTYHNIICMFLKRKTISKPEKSSLSYTNQGKTTILPWANNGIQLVYSIVCNFNGIVYLIILIYAWTLKSIILKSVSHTSKNSPESNIASICLRFLVLIYQCQGQGVNLQSHHSQQNEHFNRVFLRYTY